VSRKPNSKPSLLTCLCFVLAGQGSIQLDKASQAFAKTISPLPKIDWPAFLSRSDLVWQTLPDRWDRGAFTGNGTVGAMVYVDKGALSWELGRVDVVDNQPSDDPMVASPRLPLGYLRWQGCTTTKGQMRLNLWNAEVEAEIQTAQAAVTKVRTWTHATQNVVGIALEKGGCTGRFEFDPADAKSDRAKAERRTIGQPQANPPVEVSTVGSRSYSVQRLSRGGAYVTATDSFDSGKDVITFATIAFANSATQAMKQANRTLSQSRRSGWNELTRSHQVFWHGYYPQSFVSVPDSQIESFYWAQMYKLASATRANGPVIDTLGPWYHNTPWPGIWWNLNVQLSYWPAYTANRLPLAESLPRALNRALNNLRANARPLSGMAIGRNSAQDLRSPMHVIDGVRADEEKVPREHGNLLWALHNVWTQYRYTLDQSLQKQVVGMLTEGVAYYLDLLTEGADGKWHLPVSISPEYPTPAADTNYDLSLLTWALQTLLLPENALLESASNRKRWGDALAKLPKFAENDQGFMIGRDVPLSQSHRHFSHLLMIYPLKLVSPDEPDERLLIEKSLSHWIGKEDALEGYSQVVASMISSVLGKGDAAAGYISKLIRRFVRRNTMYTEAGPVIETPLAAAQAVHEMLLQSREGDISVFPSIPAKWLNVSFRDLRADGAFLVSAERAQGETRSVRVVSLRGQSTRLQVANGSKLTAQCAAAERCQRVGENTFALRLRKGEMAVFVADDGESGNAIPVAHHDQVLNPFGNRRENAWLSSQIVASASVPNQVGGSAQPLEHNEITTWQLLDVPVSTVFTDNGVEEIYWQHTSCDPCVGQERTQTDSLVGHWKNVSPTDGCFDFRKLFPSSAPKDTIAYLRASFFSRTEHPAELKVGLNDQGRVWFWTQGERPNSEASILVNEGGKTLGVNESRVPIVVRKGLNHVFVKVINQAGGWGACVRL
jgi:alpha-L-fucosidase 2